MLRECQPFDCVLQFGNVKCDVTSENSRQMYESTPFCLANNKVLDLGKYCEFDPSVMCLSHIYLRYELKSFCHCVSTFKDIYLLS